MITIIKNIEYKVEELELTTLHLTKKLIEKGFDGKNYILTGKRGALKMAYKSSKTGNFILLG